jgi:hypothetical protein
MAVVAGSLRDQALGVRASVVIVDDFRRFSRVAPCNAFPILQEIVN